MGRVRPCLPVAAIVLVAAVAHAGPATDVATDPVLEARVEAVASELRCLVCQNQTVADSHAPLAIDLKNQVREQLAAGRDPQQVIDYMTERYGDFVRYRPPLKATTVLLWAGPFLLLAAGGVLLGARLARRRSAAEPAPSVSSPEWTMAESMLAQGEHRGTDDGR